MRNSSKKSTFHSGLLLLGLVTLFGVGCSSGGGDGTAPIVPPIVPGNTVTLNVLSGQVAFQDGAGGAWQAVDPDVPGGTVYTLTVNSTDGKYGLAVFDVDTSVVPNQHDVTVVQATLSELASGGDDFESYDVSVTVNNIAQTGQVNIFMYEDSKFTLLPGDNVRQLRVGGGLRDLGVVEFDNVLARGVIQRGIDISGNTALTVDLATEQNVTFLNVTSCTLVYTGAGVRDHAVHYVTTNQTPVSIGDTTSFFPLATGTQSNEFYSVVAGYEDPPHLVDAWRNGSDLTVPSGTCVDLDAIERFFGVSTTYSQVSGLNYVAGGGVPEYPIVGYGVGYMQEEPDRSDNVEVTWQMILSSGWLGNQTSYARPNLSGVFTGTFELEQGANTGWQATTMMSNSSLQEMMNTSTSAIRGFERDQAIYRTTQLLN